MILTELDRKEALRYMGCKGEVTDSNIYTLLDECEAMVLSAARPVYIYRVFPIKFTDKGIRVGNSELYLTGEQTAKHFENCNRVVIMCATVGAGVDALLRRLQIADMAKAIAADAMAGVAVEQLCNRAEEEIFAEVSCKSRTWRYSPGYGDLPLETQKKLIEVMDAPRKLGLCLNDSLLMTPIKSVTAIIGLSDGEVNSAYRGCECCNMRERCNFRKNGGHCGQ